MTHTDFDVLVVGAGISGINAAYRLQTACPGKAFAILEARDAIGGTWDLFRFPGIRSDSDMYTLAFPFRPWTGEQTVADGEAIRQYVVDTARAYGIDRRILFGHAVRGASWSSAARRWTVRVRTSAGEEKTLTARFLFMCTGYYRYDRGYTPDFPGVADYRGRLVHPQSWSDDVVYEGKRVVVVGSGATAVGLVPALAKKAAHVTMLQRSPTYMISMPAVNPVARWLGRQGQRGYALARTLNLRLATAIWNLAKTRPGVAKRLLIGGVRRRLGPDYDVATHFTPSYEPWDQRLCLVRDGDLFDEIKAGHVEVVTDHIDRFTPAGVRLRSGRELEADVVVTATGLELQMMGGAPLDVDGAIVELPKRAMYKSVMLADVPNMALVLGYINASWTLRADLICEWVCRLLTEMDAKGMTVCTPKRAPDESLTEQTIFPLETGYVKRARDVLPRQGTRAPWRNDHDQAHDLATLRFGQIDDGVLELAR